MLNTIFFKTIKESGQITTVFTLLVNKILQISFILDFV